MTPAISIRMGDERDRNFVLDLGRRVCGTSLSAVRPAPLPLVELAFDRLFAYIFLHPHDLLIATAGSRRCGFLVLLRNLPDEVTTTEQAFVAYMAVEPDDRRRGAGAALLRGAEDIARADGLGYLSLMVTEDNVAARRLYGSLGLQTERRMMTKALV
ncbi:MAG: GNAT family N-acetyltransferase [Candidatus Velthaea sp.]|jgi:ribosomal protein S18 acetylase RimI-like enzyme